MNEAVEIEEGPAGVSRGPKSFPFTASRFLLLQGGIQAALVAAGSIAMDKSLPGRTIEELNSALLVSRRGASGPGLLECGTQRRTLRAITDSGCPRLPKVLGGRCNSGQGELQ